MTSPDLQQQQRDTHEQGDREQTGTFRHLKSLIILPFTPEMLQLFFFPKS